MKMLHYRFTISHNCHVFGWFQFEKFYIITESQLFNFRLFFILSYFFQLKGSELELTIVKGSTSTQAPLNGPACAYVNLRVKVNKEQGSIDGVDCKHISL